MNSALDFIRIHVQEASEKE